MAVRLRRTPMGLAVALLLLAAPTASGQAEPSAALAGILPVAALSADAVAPAAAAAPAAAPAAVALDTECPPARQRGTTYLAEDFNRGGVYDQENGGFYLHSQISRAGEGGGFSASGVPVAASGPLVLSFRARSAPDAPAGLVVRANGYEVAQPPLTIAWTTFRWEVSSFVSGTPARLSLVLDHSWDIEEGGGPSAVDIDDIAVFSCVTPPASGVRGDWTGDGTVDVLAAQSDGRLYAFPGSGRGTLGAPRREGVGWSQTDWFGSPGDVTGDRRTDLLANRFGRLFLYPGRGAGSLGQPRQIGVGWAVTQIVTPGDTGGDGRPDLWGVRSNGTLHLYHFTASATLRYDRQIGAGWNGTRIVGMGDLTGDGHPDVVAVRSDSCMYVYPGTATSGLGRPSKLFCGWGIMDWLGSPGDLTGDGLGDLLARNTAGTLWLFRGLPGGRLATGVRVSDGWESMRLIG